MTVELLPSLEDLRKRIVLPRFAGLPVIVITARATEADRDKSLRAGANGCVTSPVDIEELLACMERWVAVRERGGGDLPRELRPGGPLYSLARQAALPLPSTAVDVFPVSAPASCHRPPFRAWHAGGPVAGGCRGG